MVLHLLSFFFFWLLHLGWHVFVSGQVHRVLLNRDELSDTVIQMADHMTL
jgi:hypothetical protein